MDRGKMGHHAKSASAVVVYGHSPSTAENA